MPRSRVCRRRTPRLERSSPPRESRSRQSCSSRRPDLGTISTTHQSPSPCRARCFGTPRTRRDRSRVRSLQSRKRSGSFIRSPASSREPPNAEEKKSKGQPRLKTVAARAEVGDRGEGDSIDDRRTLAHHTDERDRSLQEE